MNSKSLLVRTCGLLTCTALVSCGGGGGGGPTTAGIDGTGSPNPNTNSSAVSLGTVTGFGSVFVNGVRFDTTSTSFDIDGTVGTQDDLSVGDVVLVVGSIDTANSTEGTASTIVFDDAVEGPVQSIDLAANTLVVLGQTVIVDADTSFDDSISPPQLSGVSVDDIVEVSGLRSSSGAISATRIEAKPAGLEYETTGFVSNLNSSAMQFNINELVVDYSSAMLDNFPGSVITDGNLVEVKGMTLGAAGELAATRVEFKLGDLSPDTGNRVEIEGFVTRFVSATDFDVSGLAVTTTTQTSFVGGVAADLGLDIKVEVEGTIDANGVLVATKVDIRRSRAIRLAAQVDTVDAANLSFVALGITIKVDALTRIEDKSNLDVEPFSISDLAPGDYVEVRGVEFPAGSGELLAGRLEREDLDPLTELQGFVQTFNEPSFAILGVTVTTGSGTQFMDATNSSISADQFYGQIAVGSLVKAQGTEMGTQGISASQVEFENE